MRILCLLLLLLGSNLKTYAQYIEEVNYDILGTDVAGSEFIEVFLPTGADPATYVLYLINGSTPTAGTLYGSINLSTGGSNSVITTTAVPGGTLYTVTFSAPDGLQNGTSDAVILYSTAGSGSIVQSVAYEGAVTVVATGVPAGIAGVTIASAPASDTGASPDASIQYNPTTMTWTTAPINKNAVLPIKLTSFSARLLPDNGVILTWQTQTESNNALFTIEKSEDGARFVAIGNVAGCGNCLTAQHYTFVDAQPSKGTHYYRLKQTDFDGQSSYSTMVNIHIGASTAMTVYYQPSSKNIYINVPEATYSVWVFNAAGQLVLTAPAQQAASYLSLAHLPKGIYMAKVFTDDTSLTQKVLND